MISDSLEPLLTVPGVDPSHVDQEGLAALGSRVTVAPLDAFIPAAAYAPGLSWDDGQDRPVSYLEIHDRDWWIDTGRPGNRAFLTRLLVAAAVVDALGLELTLTWATRVLPAVLDIEAAAVDDAGVHLAVRRRPGATLPDDLVDDVNPHDFAEFVAAVDAAEPVVPLPAGGTITFSGG